MNNVAASGSTRRLNGRSLQAGYLIYGLFLLFCLFIFGYSLRSIFVSGVSACDSIYNAEWTGCADWFAAMKMLGITAVAFQS